MDYAGAIVSRIIAQAESYRGAPFRPLARKGSGRLNFRPPGRNTRPVGIIGVNSGYFLPTVRIISGMAR